MQARGVILAWVAVLLLLAAAIVYAQVKFDGVLSAGVGPAGHAASGAMIAPDAGARAPATGVVADGPGSDAANPSAPGGGRDGSQPAADRPPAPAIPPPLASAREQAQQPPATSVGPPPRTAFAVPHRADDGKPKIAIIMTEIGLARARSRQAIDRLPAGVTFAVMAYAPTPKEWLDEARAAGHETLLAIPMEPIDYPRFDPGPEPLLIDLEDLENLARFDRAVSKASGFVGVLGHMGSRFLSDPDRTRPILAAAQDRGLIFIDPRSGPDSTVAKLAGPLNLHVGLNDRFVDAPPSRADIEARLKDLETLAQQHGHAIGIATPYPVSIEQIRTWAEGLAERGLTLAPISAIARIPQ